MASLNASGWGARLLLLFVVFVVIAFVADFVLMRSRYNDQRRLLADVPHFPVFDYEPFEGDPEYNEDGIRSVREAEDFDAQDCNIIFLGDSFVFGMRVWPFEAVPQQLEGWADRIRPTERIRVANFGWVSASPYLSKDVLAQLGAGYKPDVVLLAVDVTDAHEDIKYRRYAERTGIHALLRVLPSFVLMAKEIATAQGWHEAWFGYPADRLFPVNRSLEDMRPHMAETRANIDAIASYAREELGARFALLVLPRHYHYSQREAPKDWETGAYERDGEHRYAFFGYFNEMAGEVDYPVRSLLPVLRQTPVFPTTFYRDPHWTPATHRFVARALLQILDDEQLLCASLAPSSAEGVTGPDR